MPNKRDAWPAYCTIGRMKIKNKDNNGFSVIGLMTVMLVLTFGLLANAALMQAHISKKVSHKKQLLAAPMSTGNADLENNRKVEIKLKHQVSAQLSPALSAGPAST